MLLGDPTTIMIERRRAKRAKVNLNARWEGVATYSTGTITDLSASGCFILTNDNAETNELIRIEMQLYGGKWIYMWGEIVYRAPEIGFGLRFTGSPEPEQTLIARLIEYALCEEAL
jgi:hypothetical protein